MNDLVDRLAVAAAQTQTARTGTGPPDPDTLGPGDVPGAQVPGSVGAAPRPAGPTAVGGATVEGHAIAVFGHKPTELGGYGDNPLAEAVRSRLADILAAKAEMHDDLVVVTGLRLGAEQLGAEAALDLGLPYVVVLPYPDPQKPWPPASQAHFEHLRDQARDLVLLQRSSPDSAQEAGAALRRRDAWLSRNVAEAVLVWDGEDELLGRLHRSLVDHLGDDVWVVDPHELVVSPHGPHRAR